MSLESVINGFVKSAEWIDEQVLREYSKITKKWESEGRSRYSLANCFALSSFCSGIYSSWFQYLTTYLAVLVRISNGTDIGRNIAEPFIERKEETDGTIAEPPLILYYYKQFADIARFPLLTAGILLLGKSASEFYDYFTNKNSESLNFALYDSYLGYNFFATACSMYIKESNLRLLDKDPAWKQGCSLIKNRTILSFPKTIANYETSPCVS